MAEKTAEKTYTDKFVLFNHSRNPFHLKDGPPYDVVDGKPTTKGVKRRFEVGASLECLDQAEYDLLKGYKGVSTTAQAAPGLSSHIERLTAEKNAAIDEVADLKRRLEKFESKGK